MCAVVVRWLCFAWPWLWLVFSVDGTLSENRPSCHSSCNTLDNTKKPPPSKLYDALKVWGTCGACAFCCWSVRSSLSFIRLRWTSNWFRKPPECQDDSIAGLLLFCQRHLCWRYAKKTLILHGQTEVNLWALCLLAARRVWGVKLCMYCTTWKSSHLDSSQPVWVLHNQSEPSQGGRCCLFSFVVTQNTKPLQTFKPLLPQCGCLSGATFIKTGRFLIKTRAKLPLFFRKFLSPIR